MHPYGSPVYSGPCGVKDPRKTVITMASKNGSNGTEDKGPSKLELLHEEWKRNGSKVPSKAQAKDAVARWKATQAAKAKAEEALAEAHKADAAAAEALVLLCGSKKNLTIDGTDYVPMSRGDRVFLRRVGAQESVDLG